MHGRLAEDALVDLDQLRPAVRRILDVQRPDGAIPWFEAGPWDPWNHVECAMALCVMGEIRAARAAFDFLDANQRDDGAWMGQYGNVLPMVDRDSISRAPAPAFLDSNFCAYPAVGVMQFLVVVKDWPTVRRWWPMVARALDFVLTLQRSDGSFSWAQEAVGTDEDDALLAGNASIAMSLRCGLSLAGHMGMAPGRWLQSYDRLQSALQSKPWLFDRHGRGARHAMDWYYPVLAGVLDADVAHWRIERDWNRFVIEGLGCRCVDDEPWVTVAETAELVMALLAIGQRRRAHALFSWLLPRADEHGVFWMGWQQEEQIVWPREQPSWTQAALILAGHAIACSASDERIAFPGMGLDAPQDP